MKISDFAKCILEKGDLSAKLFEASDVSFDTWYEYSCPKLPSRISKLKISTENIKFPKGHFHLADKKALALHSFANHELLAIEMMACALLIFPHKTEEDIRVKKGILNSLKDEQKHFKLYVDRLNELGYEFGDFPLNDFFWSYMGEMKTLDQYFACMALTFEAANLDFASYFKKEFEKVDDMKTAKILEIVLKDEISHVGLGVYHLNKWKEDQTLWEYYLQNLIYPLTPSRSRGQAFNEEARLKANLGKEYIQELLTYSDEFKVTNRKEWK